MRSYQVGLSNNPRKISQGDGDQFRPALQCQNTILDAVQFQADPYTYTRRHLNIEAVQCIQVEEGSGGDALYTFLVKPLLIQDNRAKGGAKAKAVRERAGDDNDNESPQELQPYRIQKPLREVLELSTRLLSSFETLLDARRGGPQPLTKELLVSKWNVKDFFKRKKKLGSVAEFTQPVDGGEHLKMEVINDFFLKVLRTGGEVLSSSRAMQDFL